jgi:hypothetical protein
VEADDKSFSQFKGSFSGIHARPESACRRFLILVSQGGPPTPGPVAT